jgi:hypothetical protein
MATNPADRQAAIDLLTAEFVKIDKDPAQARDVATAVIDQAIADESDKRVTDAAGGSEDGSASNIGY